MPTPMTANEYAQTLIDRFKSIRTAVGDQRLRQIFSGTKRAIPTWLDPAEAEVVNEAYQIAERELFPPKGNCTAAG